MGCASSILDRPAQTTPQPQPQSQQPRETQYQPTNTQHEEHNDKHSPTAPSSPPPAQQQQPQTQPEPRVTEATTVPAAHPAVPEPEKKPSIVPPSSAPSVSPSVVVSPASAPSSQPQPPAKEEPSAAPAQAVKDHSGEPAKQEQHNQDKLKQEEHTRKANNQEEEEEEDAPPPRRMAAPTEEAPARSATPPPAKEEEKAPAAVVPVVGQEYNSPSHRHPLKYRTKRDRGAWRCDLCKKSGGEFVFNCKGCDFDCCPSPCVGNLTPVVPTQAAAKKLAASASAESAPTDEAAARSAAPPPKAEAEKASAAVVPVVGQEYNSPSHRHPLKYRTKRDRGAWRCDLCKKSGGEFVFNCKGCDFDCCPSPCVGNLTPVVPTQAAAKNPSASAAAEPAPTVGKFYSSAKHAHPLHYLPTSQRGKGWSCDVCGKAAGEFVFHCALCRFDTHEKCKGPGEEVQAPAAPAPASSLNGVSEDTLRAAMQLLAANTPAPKVKASELDASQLGKQFESPTHEHPMTYQKCPYPGGSYGCDICGQNGAGAVFHCAPCSFDAHPRCFKPDMEAPAAEGAAASKEVDPLNPQGLQVGYYYNVLPSQHPHKLCMVTWPAQMPRNWLCDLCGKGGGGLTELICFRCNFDMCSKCAKLYDPACGEALIPDLETEARASQQMHMSSVHEHSLQFYHDAPSQSQQNGIFGCNICRQLGAGQHFACTTCASQGKAWACHVDCFKADGPGSEAHTANMVQKLWPHCAEAGKKPQVNAPPKDLAAVTTTLKAQLKAGADGLVRFNPSAVLTAVSTFKYSGAGFAHPSLGVRAAPIWNAVNAKDPAHQYDLLYSLAAQAECQTAEAAAKPLRNSLRKAVFFDLYKLQDWLVDRLNTDMNAVVWHRILDAHAEGESGFKKLESEGILVVPIADMPATDSAFLTHRWNGVQGIAGMSVSFLQTFVYTMATAAGHSPTVLADGSVKPFWIWLDYLSVPQNSWESKKKFSADEIAVRERLNLKYIQFIGLEFGTIARTAAHFLNFVPMSFEHEGSTEVPADHKLSKLVASLKSFGMPANFHLQDRKSMMQPGGTFAPIKTLAEWKIWQDRSYVQRIWCVAEYSSVFLAGESDRVCGAALWYHTWLTVLFGAEAAHQFNKVESSYYTQTKLKESAMFAFGAWQKGEPAVERPHDATVMKHAVAGTICQHFLTLEGAILSLAQAIATVKSDVPLVTDAFYKDVVAEGMKLKAVPAPLLNLRNWILRCARCGYDVPAIADPTVQNPRQDFLRAFERDGILHTYFKWLVKYMRQGFNSMMWLDALVCWVAILQLDASKQDANDPFDLPMDPIPDAQIKPGYRNARHAWTWLVRTLGIKPEDVPLYFMPLYSTRGWSAFTPLTKATPFDVSGAGPGIDSSHVQFITASNDPHMDMLDDFRVLGESPYRLLYRVRSSYANSYEDSVFPSVNLGEACAIPNKHFSWPLPLEVDPATAHKCVRMGDQVYGLIPEAEVIPTEQIFRPDVKAVKGGIAQPIWKILNHVARFRQNFIMVRPNVAGVC